MSAACEKDVPDRGPATLRLATWSVFLGGVLVLGTLTFVPTGLAAAGAPVRRDQERFMWAMAGQESGWDYYARNASSGAFGRYQIMPFNWPAWAAQYLGDGRADQTPWNQETVAFGKIGDLYRWLGSWKRVAYWWLTGQTDGDVRHWSSYAKSYVSNIMRLRQRAPRDAGVMPARSGSRSQRGDWRRAAGQQRLRLAPGERPWPRHGTVADGQVLRVRHVATGGSRVHWIAVVTRDGRLGWLPQLQTLPATRPAGARKWRDVDDLGRPPDTADRRMVRPRPR